MRGLQLRHHDTRSVGCIRRPGFEQCDGGIVGIEDDGRIAKHVQIRHVSYDFPIILELGQNKRQRAALTVLPAELTECNGHISSRHVEKITDYRKWPRPRRKRKC